MPNSGELEFMKYNYCEFCAWTLGLTRTKCWQNCEALDEALEELRAGFWIDLELGKRVDLNIF